MKTLLLRLLRSHNKAAHERRTNKLAGTIVGLLVEQEKKVLSVGAGDGMLSKKIAKLKCIEIEGVDVKVPPNTHIKVKEYDGRTLPFKDSSFDVVLLIDVLHHCPDQRRVLEEARRVAKSSIIIKDHVYSTPLGWFLLTIVDSLSNKPNGIITPFNFLKLKQWRRLFSELKLTPVSADYDYKQKRFDMIKHIMVKLEK